MDCRLPDITVHYEAFGEGRPLIVLPGWPDDWRVPADYLEPLFRDRTGWRRVYLDLPGRGQTKGEPWITSNDQVLEIVLDVLGLIIPDERFVLAGHSAGAYLARAVLNRRAGMVDGLLQVVPVMDPLESDEALPQPVTLVPDETLMARIEAELGPELAAVFARRLVVQSPHVYERFKALLPGIQQHDEAFLARLGLHETLSFDVDRLAAPFRGPALFLLGRQDAVVGYRTALDLIENYPRATVAVLDRAGHGLPWEQEDLFMALAREWLARVEEATAIPGQAVSRAMRSC